MPNRKGMLQLRLMLKRGIRQPVYKLFRGEAAGWRIGKRFPFARNSFARRIPPGFAALARPSRCCFGFRCPEGATYD